MWALVIWLKALFLSVPNCTRVIFLLQFEVLAQDRGRTSLTSQPSPVVIDILKNQNPPVFSQSQYTAAFNEDEPVGYTVIRIAASDADTVVSGFALFLIYQSVGG